MLIQFNFKNYKSFRDEATLDLSATKMTDFSERVVAVGGEKLLPIAAIYGANASGKSNVFSAFVAMRQYVLQSFNYGDEETAFEEYRPSRFAFDVESEHEDTSFEVYFTIPGDKKERVYNYGFCLGQDGVTEEWLNSRAKTARMYTPIFYRDEETLDFINIPQNSRENIEIALEKQVLIVSLGAKLKVEKCKLIRDWFLHSQAMDFGNVITNLVMSRSLPRGFVQDESVRGKVVDYLSSFDKSIKGFEIEKVPSEEDNQQEQYIIQSLHDKAGSEKEAKISLHEESAGTLKMFALFPVLQDVLQRGSVLFVDELNAKLHPLLVRNFLQTFLNPEINVNHAQLVFTTHDTWQLSNQLLRRDEIWFTEKDDRGASFLYSLAEFTDEGGSKPRKDENYEKNYLTGKYGATPSLKSIDPFKE